MASRNADRFTKAMAAKKATRNLVGILRSRMGHRPHDYDYEFKWKPVRELWPMLYRTYLEHLTSNPLDRRD